MFKKLLAFLLTAILTVSLCSCGDSANNNSDAPVSTESVKGTEIDVDSQGIAAWGINIDIDADDWFETFTNNEICQLGVRLPDRIIAPGTDSKEHGGQFNVKISGTSEAAIRYTMGFTEFSDIVLHKGDIIQDETTIAKSYTVDDDGNYNYEYEDYEVLEDYSPVKFSIVFKGSIAGINYDKITVLDGVSLTDAANLLNDDLSDALSFFSSIGIQAYFEDGKFCFDCPAGIGINGSFYVSWAWDFIDGVTYDIYDTYIGNHCEHYPISYEYVVSAKQID